MMKWLRGVALSILFVLASPLGAQRVIPLYSGAAPGSESWTQQEREYYSKEWQGQVVANVTKPTLTAYLPARDRATGTAVVIYPGGGFYALSIDGEGIAAAKWLASKGVAAFILKYRLVKTGDNAPAELDAAINTPGAFETATRNVIPLAVADGRNAVAYVRAHAAEFGVSPDRVGVMGFSAGGTIVTALAFHYDKDSRPAFLAPIYAYTGAVPPAPVPSDAPPMFVVAATDDDLGLAPQSVDLYSKWAAAKKPAELHMYSKGGHGFGMRTQGTPSDTWIDRFGDWLGTQGLLKK